MLVIIAQTLLAVCAVIMSYWAGAPWLCSAGLTLLGAVCVAASMSTATKRTCLWAIIGSWAGTAAVLAGVFWAPVFTLDFYHATVAWLIAAALFLSCRASARGAPMNQWRLLAVTWAFLGAGVWLGAAYVENRPGAFHLGLLFNVLLLLFCRPWLRLGTAGIQTVNTLTLLLVALPVVDFILRPSYREAVYLEPAKRYYSYVAANKDPATFARWCRCFAAQWELLKAAISIPDPSRVSQLRLRPNSQGKLFDSSIVINSKGFRGKEFAEEKGRAYRIITLGESTTFGITLKPGDKPWPELLEQMIAERLHPERPVEVINAGVPANHLGHTLHRLPLEILPLKPDLLICYYGYNGFGLLRESTAGSFGRIPPAYNQRPLKLLGDWEYRLKVMHYKRRLVSQLRREAPGTSDPMGSQYAKDYRQLIDIARTNHIRLVLANFSMAVNSQSDPGVITFYRAGFPSIYWQIQANAVHSRLIEQLVRENPEVSFVNTQPGLDGNHEMFIDLVHFTQEGRRQLAETFFGGIRPLLEQELRGSLPASE